MLKVWRGGGRTFAECTSCGSYGCTHIPTETRMAPEIADALERHTAHMMSLREHFNKAAGFIAAKVQAGEMAKPDAQAKIREIWTNHVAQVQTAQLLLPSPDGKVKEVVTACPWCGVQEEVEIEALPEEASEPEFELVRPVAAYLTKLMKKGG